MRPVELEIVLSKRKKSRQVIYIERKADPSTILQTARQMKEICHWKKVRVGLGQDWSNWL